MEIGSMARKVDKHPETLQEAIEISRKHEEETGIGLETVPNPEKELFFNIVERTMAKLEWDDAGNIVEVVTNVDTGDVVARRKLINPDEMMRSIAKDMASIKRATKPAPKGPPKPRGRG
jgi:hypothetical protein